MALRAALGDILMLVIVDIFALSLAPTVADTVAGAIGGNVTGASATLLPLVTLLYVVVIIAANVAVVYKMFMSSD